MKKISVKKVISIILMTSMVIGCFEGVTAASSKKIYVSVNDKKISSAKVGRKYSKGYLVNAKILAKKMGAKFVYVKSSKTVTVKKKSKKVILKIGNKKYKINSKSYKSKLAPKKYGSSVYVDPKALAKAFSYKYVKYFSSEKVLNICKKKPQTIAPIENEEPEETANVSPSVDATPTPKQTEKPEATPKSTATPEPVNDGIAPIKLPATVSNSLTRVIINTENKKELTNNKDEEIRAVIYIDDGKANPSVKTQKSYITLTGRGNSTFYEHPASMPKKPMKFEFDKGNAQSVCGMPSAREWNLLSNLYDRTLIRNCIGLNLAKTMNNLEWTPGYELVELYLNDDYEGVYLLTEKIEGKENRLNLDSTGDEPGFLVEWDQRAREEAQEKYDALTDKTGASVYDYYFKVPGLYKETPADVNKRDEDHRFAEGITFVYKDPSGKKLTQTQRDYIKKTCITASDAIMHRNGAPDYKTLWDVNSMIDYYIVQNFACNSDAYNFSSVYMYKHKGANQKMKMGPMWDYDIYFGNGMVENTDLNGDKWKMEYANPWAQNLVGWNGGYSSYTFKNGSRERWNSMKSAIKKATVDYINELEPIIKDAAQRNFEKWPCLSLRMMGDGERENNLPGTYKGEMDHLKKWVNSRFIGLDDYYNSWVYIY